MYFLWSIILPSPLLFLNVFSLAQHHYTREATSSNLMKTSSRNLHKATTLSAPFYINSQLNFFWKIYHVDCVFPFQNELLYIYIYNTHTLIYKYRLNLKWVWLYILCFYWSSFIKKKILGELCFVPFLYWLNCIGYIFHALFFKWIFFVFKIQFYL